MSGRNHPRPPVTLSIHGGREGQECADGRVSMLANHQRREVRSGTSRIAGVAFAFATRLGGCLLRLPLRALPLRAPSASLHVACSGPVHWLRSGVWPRCHGAPGAIHRVGMRQVVAWQAALPAWTMGFHWARSFWWLLP